eukprot:TRINITY_DN3928_c0_g1_i1.p1 TRINITY_DN3928_c0_g1~~TRINITY_DN3928_c0_g1_i1.p1  ORF type:complete len:1904 (+),score=359.78 TRINITY_DN3928_c0_g1_i1:88-5799(+)
MPARLLAAAALWAAAAAQAELDECTAPCPTCENGQCSVGTEWYRDGQTCEDMDRSPAVLNDWVCTCPAPATGSQPTRQALCVLDECQTQCSYCGFGICPALYQTCTDPDTSAASTTDWTCECAAPSGKMGPDLPGEALCVLDECAAMCPTCAGGTCTDAAQTCDDPGRSTAQLSDWVCRCVYPAAGTAAAAAADCEIDECTAACPTCAGGTCTAALQTCTDADTNHVSLSDWRCECVAPATGDAAVAAAACMLNECAVICGTCEMDACQDEGQACTDPAPQSGSVGDWFCSCVAPESGVDRVGAPAACLFDECTETCPTCEHDGCAAAGQSCDDTNPATASRNDWDCLCPPPSLGSTRGRPAVCRLDECTTPCGDCENGACRDAGQDCIDPNTAASSARDWECQCRAPASGIPAVGMQAPTVCHINECVDTTCSGCAKGTCEGQGQVCVDEDTTVGSLGDWECRCVAPAVGTAVAAVAVCTVDECTEACATCAGTTCSFVGQACVDPEVADSLADWECWCPPPSSGRAVAAPAVCPLDECEAACATCENATCDASGQGCSDGSAFFNTLMDWTCTCPAPSVGAAVAAAAQCTLNECDYETWQCASCAGTTCSSAAQDCVDTNQTDAWYDWECRCPPPAAGARVGAPVPTCVLDECDAGCGTCEGGACDAAGQGCVDPDPSLAGVGDWYCQCVPPASGGRWTGGVAQCRLDECDAALLCKSCANGTCSDQRQTCRDPSPDPAHLWDWECRCRPPGAGTAVARPVAPGGCLLDECVVTTCYTCENGECTNAGQACDDPTPHADALADWTCSCIAPLYGNETAGAADCDLDECEAPSFCPTCENGECERAGQDCEDPDPVDTSLGDWFCVCVPPMFGNSTAAQADCMLDECDSDDTCPTCAPELCVEPAQVCIDPDISAAILGDWLCECILPFQTGRAVAATAYCVLDECLAENAGCATCAGEACAAAGQRCSDADTAADSLRDWTCACSPPAHGNATVGAPADCVLDECVEECPTCATGRKGCLRRRNACTETNTSAASLSDWICTCPAPQTGSAVAGVPQCKIDECRFGPSECTHCAGTVCLTSYQECMDPDFSAGSIWDWMCVCPPPSIGEAVGRAVNECVMDECTTPCRYCAGSVCKDKNQSCYDPTPDNQHLRDWMCTCRSPADGNATLRAAWCVLDECTYAHDDCASCAFDTCSNAGQTCEDPDTNAASQWDWMCHCPPKTPGTGIASPAQCRLDECATRDLACTTCAFDTCAGANPPHVCNDTDPSVESLGDWECVCPEPYVGATRGAVGRCIFDECTPDVGGAVWNQCGTCPGPVCELNGQDCRDRFQDPAQRNDWECVCRPPFTATYATGKAVRACPQNSTDAPAPTATDAPATAGPATMLPPTPAPPTPAPTDTLAPPLLWAPPPPVPLSSVVPLAAGVGLPGMRGVLAETPCRFEGDWIAQSSAGASAGFALHPLGIDVGGNLFAGAVLGNAILVGVVAGVGVVGRIVLAQSWEGARVGVGCADFYGLLAAPSAGLAALQWLYAGVAYAGFVLVLTEGVHAAPAVGTVALVAAAAVPIAVVAALRRGVPAACNYVEDPPRAGVMRALWGRGEWVSTHAAADVIFPHQMAVVLRPTARTRYWWAGVEYAATLLAAAAAAAPAASLAACGTAQIIQGVVAAILLAAYAALRPFHRPLDTVAYPLAAALQAAGSFVMGAALHGPARPAAPYDGLWTTGVRCIEAASVVLFLRFIAELVGEAMLWVGRRRVAAQRRAFSNGEFGSMTRLPAEDSGSFCEMLEEVAGNSGSSGPRDAADRFNLTVATTAMSGSVGYPPDPPPTAHDAPSAGTPQRTARPFVHASGRSTPRRPLRVLRPPLELDAPQTPTRRQHPGRPVRSPRAQQSLRGGQRGQLVSLPC